MNKREFNKIEKALIQIQLRFALSEKQNWAVNDARYYLRGLIK